MSCGTESSCGPGSEDEQGTFLNRRWHLTIRTVLLHCSLFSLFAQLRILSCTNPVYSSVTTLQSVPMYLTGHTIVIRLLARHKKNVGSFLRKGWDNLPLLQGLWTELFCSRGTCTYILIGNLVGRWNWPFTHTMCDLRTNVGLLLLLHMPLCCAKEIGLYLPILPQIHEDVCGLDLGILQWKNVSYLLS